MSDVTEAPTQDAIAESLLGNPAEESPVEQPVAEQQVETEAALQPDTEQQETEQETAENWLPSDQDKVFPDEVYERYGERYNLSAEQAADPLVRQLLHDKINSDIWIQQQQELANQQQDETEPVEEPTPEQPVSQEQRFAQFDRMIAERTDPQVAKDFHANFLRSFGVPESEISSATPQQAMQFTSVMSKYALNLMQTFIPDLLGPQLQQQISQAYPGFGEMYERSAYAMAWDRARGSNPAFADLPAYGSKEFASTLREAATKIPGFEEMQFTDGKGKALPMMENSVRKYTLLAQAIKGRIDPQLLQKAVQTQTRNTRRAEVRRSAGNLGSGQSKAASGSHGPAGKFQSNSDIFDEETMDRYKQEHGRL